MNNKITLKLDSNQARAIGQYAIDFVNGKYSAVAPEVLKRISFFFADSLGCGIAAIGIGANAPRVLRKEALNYKNPKGAHIIGSKELVAPEKAIAANCSAVRELDSNGTNFGFNKETGDNAGEFGHNDFYPVAIAAAEQKGLDGKKALLGMLALDEIRGRLAEVFSLKTYKIDHVVHGAIASAAVYGALMGANAGQIESAIGYVVAHHIPFRAIRAGHQLSDSKGASAAISTEATITGVHRAMMGFVGPSDIFRNPQSIFRLFGKPFDLTLGTGGGYFAVMNMHFKLGLYEHQSAS
ncbi:MAG: MmgE/PrpD family protein, partial [Deltaproteobacteria bacterium]|nr:MmgE/PrpD family protein [Deltaproteobacteria bacterium]